MIQVVLNQKFESLFLFKKKNGSLDTQCQCRNLQESTLGKLTRWVIGNNSLFLLFYFVLSLFKSGCEWEGHSKKMLNILIECLRDKHSSYRQNTKQKKYRVFVMVNAKQISGEH